MLNEDRFIILTIINLVGTVVAKLNGTQRIAPILLHALRIVDMKESMAQRITRYVELFKSKMGLD